MQCHSMLIPFAQYSLIPHSDVVHSRKMASFQALSLAEHQAEGSSFLLDNYDTEIIRKVFAAEGHGCFAGFP